MELGRAIALVRGETVDLAFTTTSEWNVGDEEKLGRPHQSRPVPTETWLTFLSIPFLAQQQHRTSTSSPSISTLLQDMFFQDSGPVASPAYRLSGTLPTADPSG